MRIALISDLHIDINEDYPVLALTAEEARARRADVLVVAGDISETPERTLAAVEALKGMLDCPLYYVPGNHDMWNKNCPSRRTEEIFAAYQADESCLLHGPVVLDDGRKKIALAGDVGWVDYSFAAEGFSREALDGMAFEGRTWQDHFFNDWTKDNPGQMQKSLCRLRRQLENPVVKGLPVMAVTHMLPVRDFCVPEDVHGWGFFNAFLGGSALQDLYRSYPVRWAVCGHVHYRSQAVRDSITHYCPCLGYHTEWPLYELENNEAQTQIRNAMQLLEV